MPELPSDPAAHIAATLNWLHPGNEVFEICLIAPPADKSPHWEGRAFGKKRIVAGWFRDQAKAAALVGKVKAEGIYLTLNPCQDSLLGRANERLKANAARSNDKEMLGFQNLLIDVDPQRPAGVSSTDNEHELAILFAQQIKADLAEQGWPAPLVGDSGNGAHLVYALDLENTPENTELLKGVLGALGQRYAAKLAECGLGIDGVNFNAARLSKLYGTQTRKGDHTPERPHRYAKIIELPAVRAPVSLELLQDLAASFLPQASGGSGGNIRHSGEKKEGRVDLAAYLDHYGVEIVKVKPHGNGTLHCLAACLFDPAHNSNEAAIGQAADGKLFYQCFHNSCKGKTWAEARQTISGGDNLGKFIVGGSTSAPRSRRNLKVVGGGQPSASASASPDSQEPPSHDPAQELFNWSNLGNARRLVKLHGQDLRFNHLNKEWYTWTGQQWRIDNYGKVVQRAKATVQSIHDEAAELEWGSDKRLKLGRFALKSEAAGEIAAMLKLAQSEPGIPVLPAEFDADPWLFNCANGTIDLQTGELREHRREDLITCMSPVSYDPEATCPNFEKFLWQIMGGGFDQERAAVASALSDFLELSLGYALTGDCREQCFWIFWGSGANGKGTLMDCISEIFGSYWENIATETILARDNPGGQIRSDVACLDGPRLVTAAEIDKGRRLSESLVKSLSGQDPITARHLYGKEFTFRPQFKLFIQSNNMPIIKDLTDGMWRRLKLVEFPMDFKQNPDRDLRERLKLEAQGILTWMVWGCLAWQEHGRLMEPQTVIDAVQGYRDSMDPLKEFIEAMCYVGREYETVSSALFRAYNTWAEDQQIKREKLSKQGFGRALTEKGFKQRRGTGGVRLWCGLGLIVQ